MIATQLQIVGHSTWTAYYHLQHCIMPISSKSVLRQTILLLKMNDHSYKRIVRIMHCDSCMFNYQSCPRRTKDMIKRSLGLFF